MKMFFMQDEETRIKNAISSFIKTYGNTSDEYIRLYENIPNQEIQLIFSTLHASLNSGFDKLNSRLPTEEYTAHFWADPSRDLLKAINCAEEMIILFKETRFNFEIIEEYKESIKSIKKILKASGGSTIPPHTKKIQCLYEYPIFVIKDVIKTSMTPHFFHLSCIGKGSYANVFKYKDTFYNKTFALKRAKNNLDSKELQRFKKEYEIMSQMKHPCILDVFSFDEDKNEYIMEYVKHTLMSYIDTYNNKISNQKRILIGCQIIKAFQYIHNKGLLHRDISPKNILVKQYDDTIMIKVSDFGLVKTLESDLTSLETEVKGYFNDSSDLSKVGFANYELHHEIFALTKILYFVATGRTKIDREKKCFFLEKGTSGNIAERYTSLEALEKDFLDFMDKIKSQVQE